MARYVRTPKTFSWEKLAKQGDTPSALNEWAKCREKIHEYCMLNRIDIGSERAAGEILKQARLAELLPSVGLKAALRSLGVLA